MADQTVFTFRIDRQVAEILGEIELAGLVGRSMGVRWGDHEAQARISRVHQDGDSVSVTLAIQERLPMGAELGSFSISDDTDE